MGKQWKTWTNHPLLVSVVFLFTGLLFLWIRAISLVKLRQFVSKLSFNCMGTPSCSPRTCPSPWTGPKPEETQQERMYLYFVVDSKAWRHYCSKTEWQCWQKMMKKKLLRIAQESRTDSSCSHCSWDCNLRDQMRYLAGWHCFHWSLGSRSRNSRVAIGAFFHGLWNLARILCNSREACKKSVFTTAPLYAF